MGKKFLFFIAFFLIQPILIDLDSYAGSIQRKKSQEILQYEVSVSLKLIQVYVTDKKRNPVMDLRKEDFLIYDNGKKQAITEFEKHILFLPSAKKEIQPEIIQETEIPPSREVMNRKFFLFFDFAFNNPRGILKAKKAALHFLDTKLQPSDEIGVLSYSALKSLKLHEYLTKDHEKIRKFLESLGMKENSGRAENLEEQYWREYTGENPPDASKRGGVFDKEKEILPTLPPAIELSPEFEKFVAQQDTGLNVLNFIQKMTDLAKALRYIPGYKHIILFSSGLPYSLMYGIQSPFGRGGFGSWGDTLLRLNHEEMLKELSASNTTIYSLDTEDIATKISGDFRMMGTFSLQKIAHSTGGKYFGNINSYEKHLEKIQNSTGCYYVLGYYIDENWDGAYHEIKVKVNRSGCEVSAQRGYFNPKPFSEYTRLEKMLHLMDLALNEKSLFQTPVHFPLKAISYSASGKLNLALLAKLAIEKIQELSGRKVEIVSIIFDKEENIAKIKREEMDFSKLPRRDIYYSSFFSLRPGEYKCRLVIRNLESGRGAVAFSPVIIPNDPDYGVKLYSPLLLKAEKDAFYFKSLSTAFPFDSTQYSPLVEELEQGTKDLYVALRCSFAGIQQGEVKLLANLLHYQADTAKAIPVTLSILHKEKENDIEMFLIELQTEKLEPGEYFLYLFAEELKTQSSSSVYTTFKVK